MDMPSTSSQEAKPMLDLDKIPTNGNGTHNNDTEQKSQDSCNKYERSALDQAPCFDDFINQTGQFGKFQQRIVFTVLVFLTPVGFLLFFPVAVLTIPKHRCVLHNYLNDTFEVQNEYHELLINNSIPTDVNGKMSECTIFDKYNTDIGRKWKTDLSEVNVSRHITVECQQWVFDHDNFDRTIIEELGLVCERQHWRAHANMAMAFGWLLSNLIQGICSDTFGRRRTLIGLYILVIASLIMNAFIFDLASLLIFRFIAGLATMGTNANLYVIAIEFVGIKYRQKTSVATEQACLLGALVFAGTAFVLRDFRHLSLALAVPPVIFFILIVCLVPESPRWLIARGRSDEARTIMKKMAHVNDTKFPETLFCEIVNSIKEETKLKQKVNTKCFGGNETLLNMFRSKKLASRFGIVTWMWLANNIVFHGILMGLAHLAGSLYTNIAIVCGADVLALSASFLLVDRFGRKLIFNGFLLLASLSCLSAVIPLFCADNPANIMVGLSVIGHMCIIASYNGLYLVTAEIFPTTVRNSAIGVSSTIARLGALVAPYIADISILSGSEFQSALPLIVYGVTGIIAFGLALYLPETGGLRLTDTITETGPIGLT